MTSTAAGVETPEGENPTVYFDTLVGTDSHTPTANGIGVLGWGVGGIEAEAAALGQPITTLVPKVVGVRLTGELSEGVAAMDVALTFAQDAAREGRRRLLRRVLRPWPGQPERHAAYVHFQYDAGIRQHLHAVPR